VLKTKTTLISFFVLALLSTAVAKDFTQADLEKMVVELDQVIPRNSKYLYPVECSIVDKADVNAYATVRKEGTGLRAKMVVFTGLVKATGESEKEVRAVVAHELAHLSRGHLDDINPAARDLRNLWTRQQEFEADKYGAEALVKCGYKKNDMVALLLFLAQQHGRRGWWLEGLTADHADAKARAAEISDNPAALNALVAFDKGLAYEDARSHLYAKKLFDFSAAQWPDLTEAHINAGKCALLYYYDNLPQAVRTRWWRPDFGPLITNPHAPTPLATEITNQDREAWKDAMASINLAVTKNPASEEARALLALGYVLEPDAKADTIKAGIHWFKSTGQSSSDEVVKLRYANNAAVGYSQLGDLASARQTILDAQRSTNKFNSALGENLGLIGAGDASKEDITLAANVLFTWLNNTPQVSPRWGTVRKTFDDICTKAGIQAREIKAKDAYLCQVVTLVDNNKELGLLLPVSSLKRLLGVPEKEITFTDKWPDLQELRWNNATLSVLTERGNVMRMTSYQTGSYLELKPTDATSQLILKVSVGMTKSDLFNMVSENASVMKQLAKGGKVESWNYFPDLGMGVLIEGEKVVAITVTPVQYEEPSS
jgi:hypothetical protein